MSAYNVETYLRQCLDCIVNQTLRDIEIICVNDGSTDGTLEILNEYAANDSRIIIIDKSVNEGLAVARNEALSIARGKYIGFVDGDDLLDRDLFRKAYYCAEENKSDLVLWDYAVFWKEDEITKKIKGPSQLSTILPGDKIALLNRPAFAWTKLIRCDVAKSLAITFPKGLTYQDIPVHWKLVTQLDRISLLSERLSYYRQQPEATTHQAGWKRADMAIIMDLVRNHLEESGLYDLYRDFFLKRQLESLFGIWDVVNISLKPRALQLIYDMLQEEQWQYIMGNKPLRWQVRDFYMSKRGSLVAKIKLFIWLTARSCYRTLK